MYKPYVTTIDTDSGHSIKDLVLVILLFGALVGCWYAYQQKKNSQKHLHKMIKDMESLHKAELALENLQVENLWRIAKADSSLISGFENISLDSQFTYDCYL
jgi:hypothetical protein